MSYYIRRFSPDPLSTLIPIQLGMLKSGVQVKPLSPLEFDVIYSQKRFPLTVDLTHAQHHITQQDLLSFLDAVAQLPQNPNRQFVMDILARTQALIAIGVPDDFSQEFNDVLRFLVDGIADRTPGLYQIDGDGFYDGHHLVLKMS